jgi:hypothetical protein
VRKVVATVCGAVVAAFALVVLWGFALLAGGTECDRGECPWLGEALVDHPLAFWLGFLAVALAAGAAVARLLWPRGR